MSDRQVLDDLRFLGIPDSIRSELNRQTATTNLLPVVSPIEGAVSKRMVSPGEVVDPTRILFEVADTRQMWLTFAQRLGATNSNYTEVIAGVLPGEVIATVGSDVLRAQLLKNNLGAGCDCVAE